MPRKTPDQLQREAAQLHARADRLVLLASARAHLDTVKTELRDGERQASKVLGVDYAHEAFADALAAVDDLRAVVGELAGVETLP